MSAYEARRQARIDRLQERATRTREQSKRLIAAGDEALSHIPLGQPILIGHYSESRDRNYRNRAVGKIDRGMALDRKADELARRAEAAAKNRSISSDDPDAPEKLHEKIAKLEARQQEMKAANKIIQGKPKNQPTDEKIAALVTMGASEAAARKLFDPDFCGRIGFPSYALQNNNANIRRLKQRLEQVEATVDAETTETEYDGFTVCENADANRIQIIFPGKPDEATRSILKGWGFRWAPSESAWQRQLNANGRYAAKMVAEKLTA